METKHGVWILYLGCGAAILFGSGWLYGIGHIVLWGTLAAHVLEFFVKRSVMERAGGSLAGHFLQTLIYGLFHWKPLEAEQAGARSQPEHSG